MKISKIGIVLCIILVALVGSWLYWQQQNKMSIASIDSFEECAKAGYPIMESYPEQCATPDGRSFTRQLATQPIEVTGEFVCLPHKNTSGPQTLECAFGLKTADGTYYALSDPQMKYVTTFAAGKKYTVQGKVRSQDDSKYNIVGVIEVESVTK